MLLRSSRHLVCLCALAFVAPAAAQAQAPAGGTEFVDPVAVSLGPDGSRLEADRHELLGGAVEVAGALPGVPAGQPVVVQRHDREDGWTAAVTVTAGPGGTFEAVWRPQTIGRTLLRAVPAAAPAAQAAAAGPQRAVTIFRRAVATYYGPGFYGRRTACGKRMTKKLLGVAHRTLPCGTKVDFLHKGRTIRVPVVDRGPFRRGTSWDLTWATAKRLRFTATGSIGAVRVRD